MKKDRTKLLYEIIKIVILALCIFNIINIFTPYISATKEYKEILLRYPDEKYDQGFYLTKKDIVNVSLVEYYEMNNYVLEHETVKGLKIDRITNIALLIIIFVSIVLLFLFVLSNKKGLTVFFNILLIINVNLLDFFFVKTSGFIFKKMHNYSFGFYYLIISPLVILLLTLLKRAMEKNIEGLEKENKITKIIKKILSFWYIPVIILAIVMSVKVFLSVRASFKDYEGVETIDTEVKSNKKEAKVITNSLTKMTRGNIEFSFVEVTERLGNKYVVVVGHNNNEDINSISLVFYFYDDKDNMISKGKVLIPAIEYDDNFAKQFEAPDSYYRYEVEAYVEKANKKDYLNITNFSTSEEKDKFIIKPKVLPELNSSLQVVMVFYKDNNIVAYREASRVYDRKKYKYDDYYECSKPIYVEYDKYELYVNNS